jgi:hypothetical protein
MGDVHRVISLLAGLTWMVVAQSALQAEPTIEARSAGSSPSGLRNGGFEEGTAAWTTAGAAVPAKDKEPVLPCLRHTFEKPEELADWQCQPTVATELSREYATDGVSSMNMRGRRGSLSLPN